MITKQAHHDEMEERKKERRKTIPTGMNENGFLPSLDYQKRE